MHISSLLDPEIELKISTAADELCWHFWFSDITSIGMKTAEPDGSNKIFLKTFLGKLPNGIDMKKAHGFSGQDFIFFKKWTKKLVQMNQRIDIIMI